MIGLFALSLATPLCAQGITSAALQGRVLQTDSAPIAGAVVTAILPASGTRWQVVTDAAGRYFVENVRVGGPYVIEARAVGFKSAGQNGVFLALGQRYHADFTLERMAVELPAVTIHASPDPLLNSGRTGPAHVVSETELAALPNLARDLSAAAALGPLAALRPLGGVSIGGQNQGFNNLQVDGGVNADLYLGRSPGGAIPSGAIPEVLPHAISLETVSEFQVLAAPFDVRLGSFAGGLLNAVTKSGTNAFHGSAFTFFQNGNLVASGPAGRPEFTSSQFGGTLSGPIVRDRVHFFLNADLQQRVVPDAGPLPAQAGRTAVSESSAVRFQQILAGTYGLEPGTPGPSEGHLPAQDVFGKITVQLGPSGHLELSHHYAHGDRRDFVDAGRTFDTTALSSVAGRSRSTAHTSRLIWTALVHGRAQNEVIVSYQRLLDTCRPNGAFPLIQVNADGGFLIAGSNSVCPTTAVNQTALELTNNLTISTGRHILTLGLHGELLHFRDPLVQVSAGRWFFPNLDSLSTGAASHYDRGLPGPSPGADFHAIGLGVYAQDRWAPTPRLTVTVGLRTDIPFLPDAAFTNDSILSRLGRDTGRLPSGNLLWSPRLGVNYDLSGAGTAFLRGGIGLFSGPPPYRWLGNGYRDGGEESVVNCNGTRVPPFDPTNQPATCKPTGGVTPRLGVFDRDLKLPQNLKLALGMDRHSPGGVTATIDLLYTRAVHQILIREANLGAPIGVSSGEGRRPMYGTIDATGLATPAWRDPFFAEIFRVSNRSGDHSISLSVQARKRFGETVALYAAYAFSRAYDRMSFINLPTRANFSNTPVDGTLEDRRLAPSFFETPHKTAVGATLRVAHRVQLSFLYQGASQPPYTYVIDGDANADRSGGGGSLFNDAVYVPRDTADISLQMPNDTLPATPAEHAKLERFIEQQGCLRNQRGRIMARSSCRNGWLGFFNARITTTLPLVGGQYLEITADVLNVLNLISSRWGRYRDVTTGPSVPLLKLVGWDAANARGVYKLELPPRGIVEDAVSRWRMQLGARYGF
ncbi:MAG TPA: TonB-dependent receptor [Gemmatimonadales bacterium]|nr:TonB-dependent receptor [Gemmatimonadales bacterium]